MDHGLSEEPMVELSHYENGMEFPSMLPLVGVHVNRKYRYVRVAYQPL